MTPVVVVGSGLAGLAAGLSLARRSIPALILEQRAVPGGRTSSFLDRDSGEVLDNGQHLLIAGYRHTLQFLEQIGTRHLLHIQQPARYHFHHPDRGFVGFTLPPLWPPLNLLAAILSTPLLGAGDRARVLRVGAGLMRESPPADARVQGETIDDWLQRMGQSAEARRSFWEPLAVSIMNEEPRLASARSFRAALRGAFLQGANSAAPALPTVGLSDLLVHPAVRAIEQAGGELRCLSRASSLLIEHGRVSGVRLRDGSRVAARAVILALPPGSPLGVEGDGGTVPQEPVPPLRFSPIITVYLWLEGHPVRHEMIALVGRTVQWLFDRSRLAGRDQPDVQLCAAVISAARALEGVNNATLVSQVRQDIESAYGEGSVVVRRSLVLRERHATIALTPAAEAQRPGTTTNVANLFRAGDWTATALPATIESAIASGKAAAALCGG